MTHIQTRVIPPYPVLYRALFFLPLFLAELATVSLLSLVPSFRITRGALFSLAAMLAVFAVWAALGFAYPNQPLPLALNIVSKLLCFVAVLYRRRATFRGRDARRLAG